jgi:ubiquinone/menaquinone biosynthesis C-methylase UbiE
MRTDNFIGKWCFPLDDSLLEQSARRGEQYNFEKIALDIKEKMQFKNDEVILDVCCGNAALTRYIAHWCKEIHGVDYSEHLIETAKKIKANEAISNLHLHLSDAMNIDKLFQGNFFDKSYCYFSFQYFNKEKRELLLEKLFYVTKPDGVIFIGDIPDKTRMWNFYPSRIKFYREKFSRFIKLKEGECNLGWWVKPQEIIEWCKKNKLSVSILPQSKELPHWYYRFDVMINKKPAKN